MILLVVEDGVTEAQVIEILAKAGIPAEPGETQSNE